jgi:hypothetical protein
MYKNNSIDKVYTRKKCIDNYLYILVNMVSSRAGAYFMGGERGDHPLP